MTRTPIDYTKALVYRIAQYHTTHYVGSTTNYVKRKSAHKNNCKNEKSKLYNIPLYKFIRDSGGWENNGWEMVLIQEYPECKSSEELRKYEREHYDLLRPNLNVQKPCLYEGENDERDKEYLKEYQVKNAETIRGKNKEYRAQNAETIRGKNNEYRAQNAESLRGKHKEYCAQNAETIRGKKKEYYVENCEIIKEKHKDYYVENCEKIKEEANKYYAQNVDKIKERKSIKCTCECGTIHTKGSASYHKKTKKHINYINNLSDIV
jgi:hypothetical protein